MPPKSVKERSKTWRDRLKEDPEAYQKYLQKERERYKQRKETGSRKLVQDMTPREHRKQTKAWRKHQIDHREKCRKIDEACDVTPPHSPHRNLQLPESHQKRKGRKNVRRDRAKAYRTIEHLKVKLDTAHKSVKKLQKRNERSNAKITDLESKIDTPRSKANTLLRTGHKSVRK